MSVIFINTLKTKVDLPDPDGPYIIEVNGFLKNIGSITSIGFAAYKLITTSRPEITGKCLFNLMAITPH